MPPVAASPVVSRAVAVLALLFAGRAGASPLEDITEGGAVFTGPTAPHPTSLFINPSALSLAGQGWHLYLGSNLRLDRLSVDRYEIDADSGAVSAGASDAVITPTPGGMLAAWTSIGEKVHVGAAFHTPFAERFPEGDTALGYHSLGGYSYQAMVTAGGTYRLADWLGFGLTVSFSYSRFRYEFLRDTATEAGRTPGRGIDSDCGGEPCGFEHPLAAERYTIATSSVKSLLDFFDTNNFGIGLGLAYRVHGLDGWWLHGSYVGPAGVIKQIETRGSAVARLAPRDGTHSVRGDAEVTFRAPQSVWFGLRGPVMPGWDLVTSVRWQDMSRYNELDLRMRGGDLASAGVPEWYPRYRGLQDTVQGQVGLEMDPAARVRLGGRVRLESGATRPRRASALGFDSANAALAVGAELRVGQHLVLHGGYDVTAFLPVDTERSAFDPEQRVACVQSDYDFADCKALREGRALPTAAGDYGRLRHVISLGLRWDSL